MEAGKLILLGFLPFVFVNPYITAEGIGLKEATPQTRLKVLSDSFPPFSHLGQTADFGGPFKERASYLANLMLPVGDQTLCDFPEELKNRSESNMTFASDIPVALFVSRGKCSFDQKARVALEMQRNLTQQLAYVIVYNHDESKPTTLLIMATSELEGPKDDLKSLRFVFFTTESGRVLLDQMASYSNTTGFNPYFLQEGNEQWNFAFVLQVIPSSSQSGPESFVGSDPRSGTARDTFHWLRFVLFSLLIVSPCARAGYLWYSAGGRILPRRNDQGRIVGLQYLRPNPYWYASNLSAPREEEEEDDKLTEEQVMALPEISFHGITDVDVDTTDEIRPVRTEPKSNSSTDHPVDEEQAALPDLALLSENEESTNADRENQEERPNDANDANDGKSTSEQNSLSDPAEADISHNCTMCSICIDDFEEGEKIRMLPRCGHCFHLECIKPWLTERQGCCPLCKTPVLQTDEATVEDEDEDEENGSRQGDSPA